MWMKSSRCDNGTCVEVWPGSTRVWLRDSTVPSEVLSVSRADFRTLLAGVRGGRFR